MATRACATPGCVGKLPSDKGKFCPRCGGSKFIQPKRRGWRFLGFVVAVGVIVVIVATRAQTKRVTSMPPGRQALVEARDIAAKMTMTQSRDQAYSDILQRALDQNDFEYACQLGGEMTMSQVKDKCLMEVVEAALKAHEAHWANRAADEMVTTQLRDEALRKIMDAGASKK